MGLSKIKASQPLFKKTAGGEMKHISRTCIAFPLSST